MKINLNDFEIITWKPVKYRGLVDDDNHLIRAFVSKDTVLYVVRDLDRLRGCTSNSSNTTERYLKKDYYQDNIIRLWRKDCLGTKFQQGFKSKQMVLVDDYLANLIMEKSKKKGSETALKIFRNGIQQRTKLLQEKMNHSANNVIENGAD